MRHALAGCGLLVGLLVAGAAGAQTIYRWVDSQGEVHYTDDPNSIPPKQRKAAKVTQGDPLSELTHSGSDGARERSSEAAARRPADEAAAAKEKTWRDAFRKARQEVEALEGRLARDRKALENPAAAGLSVAREAHGGVRPSAEYEAIKGRVAQTERELGEARERLAALERRAAEEGVPLEWRR